MKLTTLLAPWLNHHVPELDLSGLHNDSRNIAPGFLFCAYPGAATDGRLYIGEAIKAGAIAVLYDPINFTIPTTLTNTPFIPLPNLVAHLSAIASRFYEEPSKKLHVTGITGTNGKTTIAYQLAQAHQLLGNQAAYIGTIGQGSTDQLKPLDNTTPDGLCLQSLFNQYWLENKKHICMEVSSHALAQERVAEVNFEQAIFTNLTLEHLDYHQTMDAYAKAKAKLFTYPALKSVILNQDDEYAPFMTAKLPSSCQPITYSVRKGSDVHATDWKVTMKGTTMKVISAWGNTELSINALGYFNMYNALAVFSSLLAWGYPIKHITEVMKQLSAAPGRMEIVRQNPMVVVDYAHTPDALEKALKTLSHLKEGRLIVVFGCGGDRDKSKRPIMGNIATRHADIAIVTSDNPRTEDPDQIIQDIAQGIEATTKPVYQLTDRKAAINKAMSLADKSDMILIAGKGHEEYQQIGQVKYPFSDQVVVKEYFPLL